MQAAASPLAENPDHPGPFAAVAHDLRRRGLAVVPCPTGKSPAGAYAFRTWKYAPGEKFVDQMIRHHGGDNIAIITALSRRKLTIIDVDDPGERIQTDALDRFGDTPLATLTPSGGLHLWYRFKGEASANLRQPEGLPIEVKTATSKLLIVVPPSYRTTNSSYVFIQGGWDDLDRLPVLKPGSLRLVHDTALRIQEGERNNTLWRYCMAQARHCDTLDGLLDVARTYAEDALDLIGRTHRLTDAEITSAAMSAWRYEIQGRNLFGRGGATILPHDPIDRLANDPDALALYVILQRHHSAAAEFVLANATAVTLGCSVNTFRATVARLVKYRLIRCVHRGGKGPRDPPRHAWR